MSASNPEEMTIALVQMRHLRLYISIFLGEQLEDIVEQILQNGTATHSNKGERMDIGVHTIPPIKKDATDRNRTSPFAFTGNKFEFRMVASSMSIAGANTVLNATVADVLQSMADRMEKTDDLDKTVDEIIYETLKEHQKVIFNGNGYSDEWIAEAEKRGLPNVKTMVDATASLLYPKTIEMFKELTCLIDQRLFQSLQVTYIVSHLFFHAVSHTLKYISNCCIKYGICTGN